MLAQDSHTFAIVDDDKRVLDGLRELLESVGYVVRTYRSPRSFLSTEDLSTCHCVITDIRMPSMDGFELEQAVRSREPAMPMILMTGRDDIEDLGFPGADDRRVFMRKPLNSQVLLQAITRLLAFRR
ncbi:response regulator [Sinorhizobium medicae]|uniref:response regulator n=1 Tax=Sinorhizobium medicae TaxID=110321 RepID=UPI000FDC3AF4|nr:response regulator [Sinorhizobium medicae]MDX0431576.1 response regulator [Sinorhizobium medicae]MDX0480405.1 response regulator [Sinorhizobium medicae]MDX0685224.1 response regulator [Sinorhizobium medicae]MDX0838459.1 response regulator [Sinorhizobium medicae]MDX0899856.1 response regulator [Sinorhizobium medicae]